MSQESQAHQEWVNQEAAREAEQHEQDTLKALYDFDIRLTHYEGQWDEHDHELDRLIEDYDRKTPQGFSSGTGRKVA